MTCFNIVEIEFNFSMRPLLSRRIRIVLVLNPFSQASSLSVASNNA